MGPTGRVYLADWENLFASRLTRFRRSYRQAFNIGRGQVKPNIKQSELAG